MGESPDAKELAEALSEAIEVLKAIGAGNADARVGERLMQSKHPELAELGEAINQTVAGQAETLRRQEQAMRELANPILRIWDDVLAIPIVGIVDSSRTAHIMDRLLGQIVATQSKCVIIDITGVDVVDTRTADNLIKMVKAAELVGATCVMTGLSPAVAQTVVDIGVDLSSVVTLRNLQDGLRYCLDLLSRRSTLRGPVRNAAGYGD
ncbi:MAG: STAS domain-containing protein [Deltaproteobacteria bacterium]|jgi:rsbT co-antagonist protein RsbR|nr:STAS domain-containing protein [Deltaproteobacteria bacterium]